MTQQILNKTLVYNLLYNRHRGEFLTLKDLPYPNTFKDMQRAVKRVAEAIRLGEKIALIGDYDVDGVVSTTVIRELFRAINYPLDWVIPNRFRDGYGISEGVIDRVDASVIITVDNGIAAVAPAKICKERGIDLIITDHHALPPQLPDAYAIIDQKQPDCRFKFKEVCGAQIAWYFSVALAKELGKTVDSKELMGIVALAIVADIMPLTGINRTMLIAGLEYLKRSKKPFLEALRKRDMLKNLNSETVAFYLAPLINSAGRLSDASLASNFLFTQNLDEAEAILEELISLNNERKAIERAISKEALKQVKPSDKIAIVWGREWHEGVVGIVASKVAEHYKIPAIVLSCKDGICKGSGRSYGSCDIFSLVGEAREHMLKFGGHKAAIGLSFQEDKMAVIKSLLNIKASQMCSDEYIDNSILGELPFSEIDFELLEILEKFEPYGEANSKPKFIRKQVEVLEVSEVGATREHKRYRLRDGQKNITAIEFRSKSSASRGDLVNIKFTISKNEYRDNVYINLYIEEIF
jgi:single-stranded-DNA-specific exonuclease